MLKSKEPGPRRVPSASSGVGHQLWVTDRRPLAAGKDAPRGLARGARRRPAGSSDQMLVRTHSSHAVAMPTAAVSSSTRSSVRGLLIAESRARYRNARSLSAYAHVGLAAPALRPWWASGAWSTLSHRRGAVAQTRRTRFLLSNGAITCFGQGQNRSRESVPGRQTALQSVVPASC